MFSSITNFWNALSETGSETVTTEREKRDVKLFNRTWITVLIIQVVCLIAHLINGLQSAAISTFGFIIALSSLYFIVKAGRVNMAKMAAIIFISIDTSINAVVFGEQTQVIDFLLLTALTPLYFFEIKNRKLIFLAISICLIPFAGFHFIAPYVAQYALPAATQLKLYQLLTWEKVFCLGVLLYIIFDKNAHYEKEMVQKENELVEQKRLYESILEQIPIDIVTMDKHLKYTYINSCAVKDPKVREWMIGKTNLEYFQFRNLDIKGAEHREAFMKDALEKGEAREFEETFLDRMGAAKHSMKGVSPIYNEQGLTGLVGYSFDITAIKEAEKKLKEYAVELERKNDDLHHFVNATSHDLKSPLRNIASHLQLLQRRNTDNLDEESRAMIAYTIKSVKHLNQLIGDIYQYAVADRNDKPLEMADLNIVLDQCLKEMSGLINTKHAVITHDILPVLKVAPSHLNMLFSNLIGNALKYNTSLTPQVIIQATSNASHYTISVADNGIGIAPEYQEKIFEIFQRLHTANEYEGTGVGLAICNKIADSYGGKIWVQSQQGKGSTFYFTLDKELVDPAKPDNHNIAAYSSMAIAG